MRNQDTVSIHPSDVHAAHIHAANIQAARFHFGMLAIIGRRNSVVAENHVKALSAKTSNLQDPQAVQVYSPRGGRVDTSELQPLGSPADLGGVVLSGDPQLYGRIDFAKDNMTAGLFMATTGTVRITFPFTEHATILEGEVTVTDETGQERSLKAGDSYFIRQGQVILWEVKGKQLIKSFFNIVEK